MAEPHKVTVTCAGCAKTQTLRPGKVEACDGYCCRPEHGPSDRQAPGLIRHWVMNAAGGFYGWQDAPPTDEEAAAVQRARAIATLGETQRVVDDLDA